MIEIEALYRAHGFELLSRNKDRTVLRKDKRYVELRECRPLGKLHVEVREL